MLKFAPRVLFVCAIVSLPRFASADETGWQDLLDRLGILAPTGLGVPLIQVEASTGGAYMPETTRPEFLGKLFTPQSGTSAISWHASEVGRNFYGIGFSMAWGATIIHNYDASGFVGTGLLRLGAGPVAPNSPPDSAKVINCSWIGSFGSSATDNEVLRRADYLMHSNTSYPLVVVGENNGAGSAASPLMSMGYNGLAVGVTTGAHSAGPTSSVIDGPGRQKPEIVAPGAFTSFSTPVVSAAAALLYETGSLPPLSADPFARRSVVIKSVLMAGAKHRKTWANNAPQNGTNRGVATQPLDPIFGADTVNINRSHLILTAGRTPTSTSVTTVEATEATGWMQHTFPNQSQNSAIYAQLNLKTTQNDLSIICNWNRYCSLSNLSGGAAPSVANLDLTIYRRVEDTLFPLTGPDGLRYFDSGNCASRSVVDNVEHVFLRGLDAGDYVIEVKRMDALSNQAVVAVSWITDQGPLLGDFNQDGTVSGTDLGLLLGSWGASGQTDLDEDGETGGSDLGMLLGAWTG